MLKTLVVILGAFPLMLGVASCGGGGKTPSTTTTAPAETTPGGTSASTVAVGADPSGQLKFTSSTLSAKAGKITIKFTNASPLPHNLTIQQGASGSVLGATPTFTGGDHTLPLTLKPGTYTFYCSVPGHREAGMQGTLTVR